ncbi:MAG: carbonic anhydrase [Candidatus Omnitrophota bacterium]
MKFNGKTAIRLPLIALYAGLLFAGLSASLPAFHSAAGSEEGQGLSADHALMLLQAGNERYVKGERTYPNQDDARRHNTAKGQHPYATIIGCSDSRAPIEHIFDAGVGDIFTIRVAGNVCDIDEIGSIEYGADHLGTPLLVILGHTHCGAVTAVAEGDDVHGSIPELVDNILPAMESVKREHPDLKGQELIQKVVEANVLRAIEDLLIRSETVRQSLEEKKMRVIGAIYDLESGKVEWMGSHPRQKELLEKFVKTGESHAKIKPTFIHTVFFWLKEKLPAEKKQQLIGDCKTYLGSIETVRKIEVGIPAGTPRDVVDNSYGVSLVVYFDDRAGQDFYQTAEKHLQFIERNKDSWTKVQVYDMIAQP